MQLQIYQIIALYYNCTTPKNQHKKMYYICTTPKNKNKYNPS